MTGVSVFSIIAVAVLFFGSVETWSIALVGFVTAGSFVSFAWRTERFEGDGMKPLFVALALVALYPLFQLLPLPLSLTGLMHPGLKEVTALSPGASAAFHGISVYPFATETAFSKRLIYLMVFLMAATGIEDERQRYRVLAALVFLGFFLALFGIIQRATWNGKLYWFRDLTHGGSPFGPFVNRNHFAGFVGMLIPLSLGLAYGAKTLEKKLIWGFLTVVMAIALFFSLSRGGIVSFLSGLLVFAFIVAAGNRSRWAGRKLVFVLFFVIALSAYLLYFGIEPVLERFENTAVSDEDRLSAWAGTLRAFRDYPVFGSGFGTFRHMFKLYQPEGLYLYWDHAHNDYLELLLEAGVVGFLLFFLFLFLAMKKMATREWKRGDLGLKAGFLSSITTMAVHSIFDFNLQIPSNAILFFAVLGLGVAMGRGRTEAR